MGNFVRLRPTDDLSKGVLQDAEKFIGYFRFTPAESLQTLHPFKIGNDDATGVAQNIGNNEKVGPALIENLVRFRRSRSICAFGENTTLQLSRIFFRDHAIDRAGREDIAFLHPNWSIS